jgi:hypothetical protein
VEFLPALVRVQDALSRKSVVPSGRHTNPSLTSTGPAKEYAAGALQMGYRVNNNPEDFREIENRFKTTLDKDGRSMADVCKEYWNRKKRGLR